MNYLTSLVAAVSFLDITLGNVITIALTMATVAMGWQKLSDKLEGQEKRMARVERDLDELTARGVPTICALHSDRLTNIDTKMDIIAGMATDLEWIKKEVQRIGNSIEQDRRMKA